MTTLSYTITLGGGLCQMSLDIKDFKRSCVSKAISVSMENVMVEPLPQHQGDPCQCLRPIEKDNQSIQPITSAQIHIIQEVEILVYHLV